jgi:hypothetical protein
MVTCHVAGSNPQGVEACGCEPIIAAAGTFASGVLTRGGLPVAGRQAVPFEGMQQGVDRAVLKTEGIVAAGAQSLTEFPPIAGALIEQVQDEQLQGALLELAHRYLANRSISETDLYQG